MKREDQQDATIRCLLITSVSTCFGHHYAHLQENKVQRHDTPIYTRHSQTHTNPQLGLLHKKDNTANIYVLPLVTEQHTKCSNRAFVLLKMGIMMP